MLTYYKGSMGSLAQRLQSKGYLMVLILTISCLIVAAEEQSKTRNIDPLYYNSSGTDNFILRWHYQYFCDHVYDPGTRFWPTVKGGVVTFDPKDVHPGDTIFIRDIPKFFAEMDPLIEQPYILVSGGDSGEKMRDKYEKYLNSKNVIAWFGIHANQMATEHPKFHTIPLGIYQSLANYENRNTLNNKFKLLRETTKKVHLLYVNFRGKYAGRERIKELFLDKPYVKQTGQVSFDIFVREMAQSCFTLSPQGTGPDSYRTWEALLVGSIPVIIRSPFDYIYEGLPVLIVDSWDIISEDFLRKEYARITSKKYDISKLYAEYWTSHIKEFQLNYRKSLR